jgi:hypothetical protein
MSYARGITHGVALGAGLMFLLDPRRGGARRAYVRDKSVRASHELEDAARVGARDLAHRIEGAIARLLTPDDPVIEDVLVARVRARLGHVCSHPHAVQVNAKGDGWIELKGPVLADEKQHVLSAIGHVRGVEEIDDDLEVHARADVPALQCEHHHPRRRALARIWTPATRLVVGAGAAALAVGSLLLGRPLGILLGGAGALRVARSVEQRNLPRRVRRVQVLRQGAEAREARAAEEKAEKEEEARGPITTTEAQAPEEAAAPESVVPT